MKNKILPNENCIKCIHQINEICDALLEENRPYYIGWVIMLRAIRTTIPANIKTEDVPSNENALQSWGYTVIQYILQGNLDYNYFLNRVCMIPSPDYREIETLKENIKQIKNTFEIKGNFIIKRNKSCNK